MHKNVCYSNRGAVCIVYEQVETVSCVLSLMKPGSGIHNGTLFLVSHGRLNSKTAYSIGKVWNYTG